MTAPPPGLVLIVDDNVELVAALQTVLARPAGHDAPGAARFETVTASRGAEALAVARSRGVDVAIVDVQLPDTSGVDLIAPLKEACPFCEVVLITGSASMDAALAALRSGAFAFVLKSFRPEELISTVEQALTKVTLKREREELERRYRAVVQLTDVLAIALDSHNAVALFNRKAAQLSGTEARQAIGRSFLGSWIPEGDRAVLCEAIEEARKGARVREVETGFVPDGAPEGDEARLASSRRVRWHLSSATHAQAGPAGSEGDLVYGIGIDVTERRLLEKRAADAEALSAMGTLALNLAHEIRNPLNAAVLQLHLLDKDLGKLDLDPDVRTALNRRTRIVGDEIGRLSRLLTEFLELTRPRGIAREPVHVAQLVDDVLDLERATADGVGVRIERDIAPDGCVAMGDQEKLKQVMLNLVVNALEAMRTGGTLTVRVASEGGWVTVTVLDTGVGIEPALLGNVFDPFFTTKEGGTGLGLSIVRQIVDRHDGRVRIESERGRGTKVTVDLPSR